MIWVFFLMSVAVFGLLLRIIFHFLRFFPEPIQELALKVLGPIANHPYLTVFATALAFIVYSTNVKG